MFVHVDPKKSLWKIPPAKTTVHHRYMSRCRLWRHADRLFWRCFCGHFHLSLRTSVSQSSTSGPSKVISVGKQSLQAYDTYLNDLRVLQNKIIRIINGVPLRTNTDYLYSQQSILSVNRLYFYNIGIFMYKYSTSMLPGIFNNFFNKIEDSHSYCTRQSTAKHLYVNFRSTTRGQRSCIYSSSIIWNFILDNFNPDCAIGSFKRQSQALFLTSRVDLFK